jgi:hypothetical protein
VKDSDYCEEFMDKLLILQEHMHPGGGQPAKKTKRRDVPAFHENRKTACFCTRNAGAAAFVHGSKT